MGSVAFDAPGPSKRKELLHPKDNVAWGTCAFRFHVARVGGMHWSESRPRGECACMAVDC